MQAPKTTGWTWSAFISWAFGPRRLARVAVLIDEARERAAFLQDVPDAPAVRQHLHELLREARGQCEALLLLDEADLAGSLADLAGSEAFEHTFEPWKRVRLAAGCAALDRMVGARLAGMARMLQLPVHVERAA